MSHNLGSLPLLVTQCHTSSTPSTPPLTCDVINGCPLNGQTDRPILFLLYEVNLCIAQKADVDGMSDTSEYATKLLVDKKWVLRRKLFSLERSK